MGTRIVPQGYADIGAYDEMDDYMQIMDWLGKVGSVYQDVKQNKIGVTSTSLSDIVDMIDNVQSDKSLEALERSMGIAMNDADSLGNTMLSLKANTVNAIVGDKRAQFVDYKKGFANIVQEYTSKGSIWNPDEWKESQVEGELPDMFNTINELGAEGVGKKLNELNEMMAQVVGTDGKLLFPQYRSGDRSGSDISNMTSNMRNVIMNVRSSLNEKGLVSEAEFNYLLKYGTDYQGMETHRDKVVAHSDKLISRYARNSIGIDKAFFKLEQNKGKTLYTFAQDMAKEAEGEWLFSVVKFDELDLNDEVTKKMVGLDNPDITIEALRQRYYFNEAGEKVPIEKLVLDKFNQYEGKLKLDQIFYNDEREKEVARFNFWSPFKYDSPYLIKPDIDTNPEDYSNTDNDGDDRRTGDPPALTSELAKEMYNTFDPTVQKQWEEISSDEVDDLLAEHKIEYPEDSGNWYNQKDVYNLVNPGGEEMWGIKEIIDTRFAGNPDNFLGWLDELKEKKKNNMLVDDEKEFLSKYGSAISEYFTTSDKSSEPTGITVPSDYTITPDSPWDEIEAHLKQGGEGVKWDSLISKIDGNDEKALSKSVNRNWVIKALQTNGLSKTTARRDANEVFTLIRKYYRALRTKPGKTQDNALKAIRQEYNDILGKGPTELPSLRLYDRFTDE